MKVLDADDSCPVRDGFVWPAEWSPHARTWMCWPCRIEVWGGPEGLLRAKQAFARIARAISTFGNAGCLYDVEAALPLSPDQRERIAYLVRMEREYGCR